MSFSEYLADPPTKGPVIVTGACGNLGRRLVRALHRVCSVVGLDQRPFLERPEDVVHHAVDLRRKRVNDVFRDVHPAAIIHLGVRHDPRGDGPARHAWNLEGFSQLMLLAQRYSVRKLVLLSSANVYGPRPENAQFLTEEEPLLASGAFSRMRDLVEIDMMAQGAFWKYPELETVVIRPAHILGTVKNAPSNYLRLRVAPTLMGFDPMVQAIHQDDVVRALCLALREGVAGIFNVAGPEPVPLSTMLKKLGRKTVPIPYSLARFGLDRLWQVRLSSFPAPELDFVRYVCMVDDGRARRELAYAPRHNLDETLQAVGDEQWP